MAEAKQEKEKQQPKTKRKTVDKWKKKVWYSVVAPSEFESKIIGETISEKPESVIGRVISITGRDLANQPKKQHVHLKFQVREIKGSNAVTEAVGHEIKEGYLRRVVRRRSSKIMSVKNYNTKDGKSYKVKFVIVTERKASNRQKAAVRKKTEEAATQLISELASTKLVDELVFGTMPNKIYPALKKIIPIKRIEITKSALIAG